MSPRTVGLVLVGIPVALLLYSYVAYPLILRVAAWVVRRPGLSAGDPEEWPTITILVPAYNEEAVIAATIERILQIDYPADRRQILIVSDASADRTDDVVREFADQGVELLRLPERRGKTAAENAAAAYMNGEIIVSTDATIRIPPASVKELIRPFQDPTVGLTSGRDVSIDRVSSQANVAEAGYVDYEMWVRSLESRIGSIVGASGCFYAVRRRLYESLFPEALSRDFASAMIATQHDLRAVSVNSALCMVPRASSLRTEYPRKKRTMARGLDTLIYKRGLMNPFRYGRFALMLVSHKLCRWLVSLTLPLAVVGLVMLSFHYRVAAVALVIFTLGILAGVSAIWWRSRRPVPRALAICGYLLMSEVAALLAWVEGLRGGRNPIWEPTRRGIEGAG